MGFIGDVLVHVAVGVGNLIGVTIRLGHREVSRSAAKPDMEIATPVRALQAVGLVLQRRLSGSRRSVPTSSVVAGAGLVLAAASPDRPADHGLDAGCRGEDEGGQ
jgi:hypothetical protein